MFVCLFVCLNIYLNFYFRLQPLLDFKCVRVGGEPSVDGSVPAALQTPLIKVPLANAPADAVRGVASGTRSALVPLDGKWYRLKGCGNNDEGFTVRHNPPLGQPLAPGKTRWRDVRGSAFRDTSLTELHQSERVVEAMHKTASLGTNGAIGLALYDGAEQMPLGPHFPTACIIESTLGDRRLGMRSGV